MQRLMVSSEMQAASKMFYSSPSAPNSVPSSERKKDERSRMGDSQCHFCANIQYLLAAFFPLSWTATSAPLFLLYSQLTSCRGRQAWLRTNSSGRKVQLHTP